ncbi:unnamed protein product [Aphanomyces euteiches]
MHCANSGSCSHSCRKHTKTDIYYNLNPKTHTSAYSDSCRYHTNLGADSHTCCISAYSYSNNSNSYTQHNYSDNSNT